MKEESARDDNVSNPKVPVVRQWVLYYGHPRGYVEPLFGPPEFSRLMLTERKAFGPGMPDIHYIWRSFDDDVSEIEGSSLEIDLSSEIAENLVLEPPPTQYLAIKDIFGGLISGGFSVSQEEKLRELVRLTNLGVINLRKINCVLDEYNTVISVDGISVEDEWRAIAHTTLAIYMTREEKMAYRNLVNAINRGAVRTERHTWGYVGSAESGGQQSPFGEGFYDMRKLCELLIIPSSQEGKFKTQLTRWRQKKGKEGIDYTASADPYSGIVNYKYRMKSVESLAKRYAAKLEVTDVTDV